MEKVKFSETNADKLLQGGIDGTTFADLTIPELKSIGIPFVPSKKLVKAAARLWKCEKIHGVILAPAVTERDCIGIKKIQIRAGLNNIRVVCGKNARQSLGGLDQLFRYMTKH